MKTSTKAAATILVAALSTAVDASAQSVEVIRSKAQAGSPSTFTGEVQVSPLFDQTSDAPVSAASVTFAAGARAAWHTHPAGQRLLVTAGVGRVQQWGAVAQEIRPGDVVVIPAGVKHWHGASRTESMTHIAIQRAVHGKPVDWLEPVTDAQYAEADLEAGAP